MVETNYSKNGDNGLILTDDARDYLKQTAKWAKFLAIVGFVMVGFMVIIALFIGSIMSSFAQEDDLGVIGSGALTCLYLVIALVYFFPTLYLYRFARRTKEALELEDSQLLTGGLGQLKSCFKYIGILMIIVLVLYAIGILAAMMTGLLAI